MIQRAGKHSKRLKQWDVHKLFWKEYLIDPYRMGSISPDSRWCVEAILRHAPVATSRIILEYGSASGSVTREIIRRKEPTATFVCIEKNPSFLSSLAEIIEPDHCHFECCDVFNSSYALRRHEVEKGMVDCIISTLPCSMIPFDRLIAECVLPYLKPDGVFVQYMYAVSFVRGMFPRKFLEAKFEVVRSEVVFLNIPPAVVYTAAGLTR